MDKEKLIDECEFKAIRSSGSGGQHVNKTSTKVELQWNLDLSNAINEEQKNLLQENIGTKLTKDSRLILQCGETRSQHTNKEIVIQRFIELIEAGLTQDKERKPTKIPKAVKQKRLANKRKLSEKKTNRKPPEID